MSFANWQGQLRKGLLEIAVLNLLGHKSCHGYEMVQILKTVPGLRIHEGNIYPVLARLKAEGLIVSYPMASPSGPPRKHYKLTELGKQTLKDMNSHWIQVVDAIQDFKEGYFK